MGLKFFTPGSKTRGPLSQVTMVSFLPVLMASFACWRRVPETPLISWKVSVKWATRAPTSGPLLPVRASLASLLNVRSLVKME